MARAFAKISFTPSVVNLQKQHGSDKTYSKFLLPDVLNGNCLGEAESDFIMERDSFYQASASQDGWPYVQYRGGPTGFLKIIDPQTLAYADFRGNRQYISAGNISENDKVSLILIDYPNRHRLKIWARAKLVTMADNPDLITSLHDETYRAKPERAVIIKVEAFDWNCPQHIHPRYTLEQLEPQITKMQTRINALQEDNRVLKAKLNPKSPTP